MQITQNPALIVKCLQKYNIFDFISDRNIDVFVIKYKKGEFLRQPGSAQGSEWLQFVIEGILHLFMLTPDGSIMSENYGTWHSHIGEGEMILGHDLNIFAEAMSDVTVLAISTTKYKEVLLNDKKYLRDALVRTTQVLTKNENELTKHESLENRVKNAMMYKCPNGILKGVELYASIFHCSPRQMQRVLNKLVEQKEIVKIGKGCYQIIN